MYVKISSRFYGLKCPAGRPPAGHRELSPPIPPDGRDAASYNKTEKPTLCSDASGLCVAKRTAFPHFSADAELVSFAS